MNVRFATWLGVVLIPKKIHYIWLGGKPLPPLAKKCLASWHKYMPDYEVVRWDESNLDFYSCDYASEAYKAKKWAFASDYARFKILYEQGGIYLDTDVEVIRSLEPILEQGPYMGFEVDCGEATKGTVASGLGLAANPGLGLYREILDSYERAHFIKDDGSYDLTTVVERVTDILREKGLRDVPGIQEVAGVRIYPSEYFCPKDPINSRLILTENSYSIHHYDGSWTTGKQKFHKRIAGVLGPTAISFVKRMLGRSG